jgi:hypothetical protein
MAEASSRSSGMAQAISCGSGVADARRCAIGADAGFGRGICDVGSKFANRVRQHAGRGG